jgi:hypothetical protein
MRILPAEGQNYSDRSVYSTAPVAGEVEITSHEGLGQLERLDLFEAVIRSSPLIASAWGSFR